MFPPKSLAGSANRNNGFVYLVATAVNDTIETFVSITCSPAPSPGIIETSISIFYAMKQAIDTPKQLGELVRRIRKEQGVRQDDLAGIVGASHVFLRDLERGKPTVQFGKALDILRELGIRLVADVPNALPPATPSADSVRHERKRNLQSDD